MSALFIVCGALAREVIAIRDKHQWDAKIMAIPALLHNSPQHIPDAVVKKIQSVQNDYERIIVIYGDCGTSGQLDKHLEALNIPRISGPHCYEMYAGEETFHELMNEEPGTFFLTDYLAQSFDHLVIEGLGLDTFPELRDTYFGNYERIVYLQQREEQKLIEKAKDAARQLGLPLEIRQTGYGDLETRLAAFMD